jgi:hypothetical protein
LIDFIPGCKVTKKMQKNNGRALFFCIFYAYDAAEAVYLCSKGAASAGKGRAVACYIGR